MFRKGPWLGQVPLVSRPSLASWMPPTATIPAGAPLPPKNPIGSIQEGGEIQANGGRIVKRIGFLWFFPDPEVLDKIEALTGERPSESIEARVISCIPIPPIVPTLGAFLDPESGFYCDIDLPSEWRCAWGSLWECP